MWGEGFLAPAATRQRVRGPRQALLDDRRFACHSVTAPAGQRGEYFAALVPQSCAVGDDFECIGENIERLLKLCPGEVALRLLNGALLVVFGQCGLDYSDANRYGQHGNEEACCHVLLRLRPRILPVAADGKISAYYRMAAVCISIV